LSNLTKVQDTYAEFDNGGFLRISIVQGCFLRNQNSAGATIYPNFNAITGI